MFNMLRLMILMLVVYIFKCNSNQFIKTFSSIRKHIYKQHVQ